MLRELLRRRESQIFISFVLGVGIAILMFHRPHYEVDISALSPAEIKDKVFNIDGKCYKFRVMDASCPNARVSL
jgi:hypothetical protein